MSDASGQDDVPVFKIKEEQKASPALEHHGTNDNSIDTHAIGPTQNPPIGTDFRRLRYI
jgi:hypothetical protein